MNFQNLINQFTGSSNSSSSTQHNTKSSGLGSGLMGGAAAGGVMALLVEALAPQSQYSDNQVSAPEISQEFQLTLIKAMIGAAKSDGHIDEVEQKRIFDAVEQLSLSSEMKGLVFDLLRQPIYIEELAHGAQSMEQKSEVYLASCLAIDLDNPCEHNYLNKLATALGLPSELAEQIKSQAKEALDSERVLN